jgi:hypothetical protein
MFTVILNYTGASGLADDLKKRSKDIEAEIGSVSGFIAYYLVKTTDGIASVTLCENKAGCDESTKRAGNWLTKNVPNLKVGVPQVIAGELAFKFAAHKTSV